MDLLKRQLAPITDKAWEEIYDQSKEVFNTDLSVRKFADVDGPHGIDMGAVTAGRISLPKDQDDRGLRYGIQQVQPLVEVRANFKLDLWELDNVERGAKDIDLEPLEKAAKRIAGFEEKTIYEGLKTANILGLKKSSGNEPIKFPEDPSNILHAVIEAVTGLKTSSIEGPYSLVVDTEKWEMISAQVSHYPLRFQLDNILGGSIILAPHLDGAFVVSERGGDFKLTLGQDLSIGYNSNDQNVVELFFTEAFTFQVLDGNAIVMFN